MSAPDHHDHKPDPAEPSHPLWWTLGMLAAIGAIAWWFAYWYAHGVKTGRDVGKLELSAGGPVEPDHAKLIADRSQAVLDAGEVLYGKNCAACHGPQGEPAAGSTARNFRTGPFLNPKGAGPYGFYDTLTNGYGNGMPAFRSLNPEQRYAVAHFVRETWVKPFNAKHYTDTDIAPIPAGGGGSGGAGHGDAGAAHTAAPPVEKLMAVLAADAHDALAAARRWTARVRAAGAVDGDTAAVLALADAQPGTAIRLHRAVSADDRAAFAAVVCAADGAGTPPPLALAPTATLDAVFQRLKTAAGEP
jgi:mono/diheme cytochrome c family protein